MRYAKKVWLNKQNSYSTASVSVFDGEVKLREFIPSERATWVEIANCTKKIKLSKSNDDTMDEFINKLELLEEVIRIFVTHLKQHKQ